MVYFNKYNSEIRINGYCIGQSSLWHCDTYYLFAWIIQNCVAFPFLCFDCLCESSLLPMPKRCNLTPQVKPLDFGWRSCVNMLPVSWLGESNFLPFHHFFHYECHLIGWGSLSCLSKKITEASEQESSYCRGLPAPSPSLCCQSLCWSASYCLWVPLDDHLLSL